MQKSWFPLQRPQSCRGLSRSGLSETIALHSLPTAWVWPNFFLPSSFIFSLFFVHGVICVITVNQTLTCDSKLYIFLA